jgi:uncharacterized protein (DUF849 family)
MGGHWWRVLDGDGGCANQTEARMVHSSRHPVTPPRAEPLSAPAATCAALHRHVRNGEGRENKRMKQWRTLKEMRKWGKIKEKGKGK